MIFHLYRNKFFSSIENINIIILIYPFRLKLEMQDIRKFDLILIVLRKNIFYFLLFFLISFYYFLNILFSKRKIFSLIPFFL